MMTPRFLLLMCFIFISWVGQAQSPQAPTVKSFAGISASQLGTAEFNVDPSGAVGTKQFVEYVNTYYQAYDKTTFKPVWSTAQAFPTPWLNNGASNCFSMSGDGVILFDRRASRWVFGAHATSGVGNYYYCIAISNTDDLSSSTLSWHTYDFFLNPILGTNSKGHVYFPDWPKLGTWADGYYVSIDLNDTDNNFQEVGVVVCALDRSNMLTGGSARAQQCFTTPTKVTGALYLAHSFIPADIDGTTAPPTGRNEYFVSIENPPNDGVTTTSNSINLWAFHVDWSIPHNSTFTHTILSEAPYTPGCYLPSNVTQTACVPEPSTPTTGQYVDSVGDRLESRFAYRKFGSYESFLLSHTVQVGTAGSQQTGVRWYELRGNGTPSIFQDGTLSADHTSYRFVPSIAEDKVGNAAVGYSVSSTSSHPSIKASWFNLVSPTGPVEFPIFAGKADEENTGKWGSYTSMTVDPVDNCTFWYVNEDFPQNQTGTAINWSTRIANFKLSTCH